MTGTELERKLVKRNENAVFYIQNYIMNVYALYWYQVSELEDIDRRWREFYENLEKFSSWLNQKESDLNNIPNMGGSPDEQFNQSKVSGFYETPC